MRARRKRLRLGELASENRLDMRKASIQFRLFLGQSEFAGDADGVMERFLGDAVVAGGVGTNTCRSQGFQKGKAALAPDQGTQAEARVTPAAGSRWTTASLRAFLLSLR